MSTFKKLGIPGPEPGLFFGNILELYYKVRKNYVINLLKYILFSYSVCIYIKQFSGSTEMPRRMGSKVRESGRVSNNI